MDIIIVTAAVILKDDKVLITQRKSGGNQEFKWEFPGGKLEKGESPEKCLIREIKEELNLDIKSNGIFDVVYHKYPDITILLLAYKCEIIGGTINAIDCNDYKWVSLHEIKKFDFSEADIPIMEKLIHTVDSLK